MPEWQLDACFGYGNLGEEEKSESIFSLVLCIHVKRVVDLPAPFCLFSVCSWQCRDVGVIGLGRGIGGEQ